MTNLLWKQTAKRYRQLYKSYRKMYYDTLFCITPSWKKRHNTAKDWSKLWKQAAKRHRRNATILHKMATIQFSAIRQYQEESEVLRQSIIDLKMENGELRQRVRELQESDVVF